MSEAPDEKPQLSKSSRFNLWLMWRINRLAIAIFVIAIVVKLISLLFRD